MKLMKCIKCTILMKLTKKIEKMETQRSTHPYCAYFCWHNDSYRSITLFSFHHELRTTEVPSEIHETLWILMDIDGFAVRDDPNAKNLCRELALFIFNFENLSSLLFYFRLHWKFHPLHKKDKPTAEYVTQFFYLFFHNHSVIHSSPGNVVPWRILHVFHTINSSIFVF